jgi:methylase of polypeptide subunit release factors
MEVDGPEERSGDQVQIYQIGRHRVAIACRGTVLPPTPYSLFLAEHIPEMPGHTVVDVGTGSGILGIVARLQGAARVYVLDINPEAIAVALENAARNAVQEGFIPVATGRTMLPMPAGASIDVVLCNPAQLHLPESAKADDPFYAGQDGRQMIEGVICETPRWLSPAGRLLMTHHSLTDFPKSLRLMESLGLEPRVLAERSLEFRPFINWAWLDALGGTARGLDAVRDGRAYETLYVVEARLHAEHGRETA